MALDFKLYSYVKTPHAVVFNRAFPIASHWANDAFLGRDEIVWCPASLPPDHPEYRSFCILCESATRDNFLRASHKWMMPVRPFIGNKLAEGFEWWMVGRMAMEQVVVRLHKHEWVRLHAWREGTGLNTIIRVRKMLIPIPVGRQPAPPDEPPPMKFLSNEDMTRHFLVDPGTLDKPAWLYEEEEVA